MYFKIYKHIFNRYELVLISKLWQESNSTVFKSNFLHYTFFPMWSLMLIFKISKRKHRYKSSISNYNSKIQGMHLFNSNVEVRKKSHTKRLKLLTQVDNIFSYLEFSLQIYKRNYSLMMFKITFLMYAWGLHFWEMQQGKVWKLFIII